MVGEEEEAGVEGCCLTVNYNLRSSFLGFTGYVLEGFVGLLL